VSYLHLLRVRCPPTSAPDVKHLIKYSNDAVNASNYFLRLGLPYVRGARTCISVCKVFFTKFIQKNTDRSRIVNRVLLSCIVLPLTLALKKL
jgi:hypothetical protein